METIKPDVIIAFMLMKYKSIHRMKDLVDVCKKLEKEVPEVYVELDEQSITEAIERNPHCTIQGEDKVVLVCTNIGQLHPLIYGKLRFSIPIVYRAKVLEILSNMFMD